MTQYKIFDKYVLRAPICSLSFYKKLTENSEVTEEQLKLICSDKKIKEALFLASPSFYFELEKWLKNKVKKQNDIERIKLSLLKYLSRMSSRCTPFGLFAGTAVGTFSNETKITLDSNQENSRHTRLDMNFLVALAQDLSKKERIKKQVLFYPNSSIYTVEEQLRYIEYTYMNGVRNHKIVGVENSEYLQKVLSLSKNGASYLELCNVLIDEDICMNEAESFINEVIESQLLTSDLEPSVTGKEFLDHILDVLKKIDDTDIIVKELELIKKALKELDKQIGNDISSYNTIINSLKKLGTDFEEKYLFQTDLVLKPKTNKLNKSLEKKIIKGINFLNKITFKDEETVFKNFSDDFYKRYETKTVELSKALDTDIGITYNKGNFAGDNSPFLDDLVLPPYKREDVYNRKWSKSHTIFQNKIISSLKKESTITNLQEKDFENFNPNWENLPDTFSSLIQLVNINGKEKIFLKTVGGSSAVKLLGRFCFGDKNILKFVNEIVKMEEEINKDAILAEIVHLPESRVGNILARPSFRKYEIPYLAKSTVCKEKQINLEDLTIRKVNDSIVLESKKYNKVIIPKLGNAHNYSYNSLPIYHFLCDLQTQNKRGFLGLNLDFLDDDFLFLPRIEYSDIIISLATWNITKDDIKHILDYTNDPDILTLEIEKWRKKNKIPQLILLVEGDNELLINLKNITSVKMFLTTIKNKKKFKITEFLFDKSILKDSEERSFTNQLIVSFYKNLN
ncbi:hypothetical protein CSC81_10575 [Tenacibaculum discolor]|uniref:Lantibiotic dehydratase family protein n=1 Tax=Tenacibaculum discolor TaxID=361581 RepID=A0A2G1BSP2_9FLAO|nr:MULTISPECIES: lantibiotic dehydratase family protein [Tenacibaculum]MDP2542384.1 lantibiotic dehydratase family protein [Tenacibaculum discolor]NVK08335.1 lantibiotic dehydratase family protein [Tenacibaculum sp.]PHN96859.1 hypothetical protein CSC81_10575 [Tenacibaculum discolor]